MRGKLNVRMCDLIKGGVMMRTILALGLIAGTAAPAAADDFALRPKTCERLITAQYSDCEVMNLFRCTTDGSAIYRMEYHEADGLNLVETLDEDFRSLTALDPSGRGGFSFDPAKSSNTPPHEIMEAGIGRMVAVGELAIFGMSRPVNVEIEFTYEGDTQDIGGVIFQRFEGSMVFEMPAPVGSTSGRIVMGYAPEHDVYIELETALPYTGDDTDNWTVLKAVSLPDQPGFGTTTPTFGCQQISLVLPQAERPT